MKFVRPDNTEGLAMLR